MNNIPNIITLLRLLLIIPISWNLLHEHFTQALILFIIAALTDLLDGQIARSFSLESRFGSILDPIADKSLVIVTFVMLYWIGMIPLWLVSLVVMRDIIVISGAVFYHYYFGKYKLTPLMSSKVNTVLQLSLLSITLVIPLLVEKSLFSHVQTVLIYAVMLTSIISCAQYIVYSFTRGWD